MTTTTAYYATPTADPSEPEYHDVTVTTEHPLSSYGQPVIVDSEIATPAQSYGRALFCYDRTDKDLVARANKLSGHEPSSAEDETYENYWNMVFAKRDSDRVVADYNLAQCDRRGVDEWLGKAEACAVAAEQGPSSDLCEFYHERALDEIMVAVEDAAFDG